MARWVHRYRQVMAVWARFNRKLWGLGAREDEKKSDPTKPAPTPPATIHLELSLTGDVPISETGKGEHGG